MRALFVLTLCAIALHSCDAKAAGDPLAGLDRFDIFGLLGLGCLVVAGLFGAAGLFRDWSR